MEKLNFTRTDIYAAIMIAFLAWSVARGEMTAADAAKSVPGAVQ